MTCALYMAGIEKGLSLFATASRPALECTQPPIQLISAREADRSQPPGADFKDTWNHTTIYPICLQGAMLNQEQEQIYLFFFVLLRNKVVL
jgi:hypothetical protein